MDTTIYTIEFDATSFSADKTLLSLLQAKVCYNELSHNNKNHNNAINVCDSIRIKTRSYTVLESTLLQLFALAQQYLQPVALYCRTNSLPLPIAEKQSLIQHSNYAFIVTAGSAFELFCQNSATVTQQYFASIIGMWICHKCIQKLKHLIYLHDSYCVISPGSVDKIPIEHNTAIYSLLQRKAIKQGITINEASMFRPLHTVAGFLLAQKDENPCNTCKRTCMFRNILT